MCVRYGQCVCMCIGYAWQTVCVYVYWVCVADICERECKQVFPCVFFNLFLQELRKQLEDLRENVFTKDTSGMLNLNGLFFSFIGLIQDLF